VRGEGRGARGEGDFEIGCESWEREGGAGDCGDVADVAPPAACAGTCGHGWDGLQRMCLTPPARRAPVMDKWDPQHAAPGPANACGSAAPPRTVWAGRTGRGTPRLRSCIGHWTGKHTHLVNLPVYCFRQDAMVVASNRGLLVRLPAGTGQRWQRRPTSAAVRVWQRSQQSAVFVGSGGARSRGGWWEIGGVNFVP